jgi:hypothetical protein
MRRTGYPKGRKGYVVDHIVPLECGGADVPSNMQWQTVQEAKIKDRSERNCRREKWSARVLAIDDLSENMEIRAINQQEIAVIETAIKRAPVIHIEDAILTTITTLKVVGRCSCGCDSVDFVPSGQAPPYRPSNEWTLLALDG